MTRTLLIALYACSLIACKENTSIASVTAQSTVQQLGSKADADTIAQKAYSYTEKILSFGHRQPESLGLRKTKSFITSKLKKYGWTCVEQKFTAKTPKGEIAYSNLIVRYAPQAGQNPWSRTAKGVLAAHIDSKILPDFLGADDAASCASSILAIAEHLHKNHPSAAKQLELVFFDGEEAVGHRMNFMRDGLYGSIHYSRTVQANAAQKLSPYRKAPEFGILLDMIGHQNLNIKIPGDTPKHLARTYHTIAKKHGTQKHFGQSADSILDDHVPMNVIAKIPTIDLIGDFYENKWWHTSGDNMDLISKESLSMSIHMTLEILSNQL